MPTLRVIHHPPAPGDWNMAVDDALAESVGNGAAPTLRFYSWRPATLSLGYFQRHEERAEHLASANCAQVRRSSGGGAILHDQELTYSLSLPADAPVARRTQELYLAVHQSLQETLATFGVHVALNERVSAAAPQPFLCFQRRAVGDVLLDAHKIAGSAQRRHLRAVTQHGSILLTASEFAPELPGIREISGFTIGAEALVDAWQIPLSERLGYAISHETLTEAEQSAAERIRLSKYADPVWTTKR
jgi:lipoate-protein ligase A